MIGAVHDVGAKAFLEAINCQLQLALPSKDAEKVKLHEVRSADEVICDQTDQAERTGVLNVIEKVDSD
jgi:hypothetical protein